MAFDEGPSAAVGYGKGWFFVVMGRAEGCPSLAGFFGTVKAGYEIR
jgi:hypothetical protein